jgi:hypothetical protein
MGYSYLLFDAEKYHTVPLRRSADDTIRRTRELRWVSGHRYMNVASDDRAHESADEAPKPLLPRCGFDQA